MCQPYTKPALNDRRRTCQVVACASLVLYLLCSQLSLRYPRGTLSLILAGCGGAFFFAELVSVGLLAFRLRDEFQRVLLMRSFVWATVITMALITIWGFVELHEHGAGPHLPIVFIPILLVCITAAAKVFIFRQHKSPAE